MTDVDLLVIGAGQAGLSSAYHLRRAGLDYLVLDGSPRPGGAWQYRWPTLTLGDVHGIYHLPGMELTARGMDRPASEVIPAYFADYETAFALPVRRPVRVSSVSDGPDRRLVVASSVGEFAARAIINATGTWGHPFLPHYPGQETFSGRQLHTVDYRGPEDFAGKRVVVVGGGTSAVQLLIEVATVAASTTWVTRRPPIFSDDMFNMDRGRAAVALVDKAVRAGLPPASVVSVTGLTRTLAVREAQANGVLDRLPMFERITPDGITWADGTHQPADIIFWNTGWRAELDHLRPLHLRGPGGGIVMDGTRVVAEPRLHLVGYGPSASTVGANRAGRAAVHEITRLLESQRALTA
ncbi:MAG TPA: FAD-dependent oxidoreductase [Pseudonocardiaceae bacterium]